MYIYRGWLAWVEPMLVKMSNDTKDCGAFFNYFLFHFIVYFLGLLAQFLPGSEGFFQQRWELQRFGPIVGRAADLKPLKPFINISTCKHLGQTYVLSHTRVRTPLLLEQQLIRAT